MNTDLKYRYWLATLDCIGPKRAKQLMGVYGNAYEVFRQPAAELAKLDFINQRIIEQLLNRAARSDLDDKLYALTAQGIDVISEDDPRYPPLIREIADPPPVLFMRGAAPSCSNDKFIAVVGTRKPSAYGISATKRIVADLAGYGFTVVSGMAAGIDAAAHRTAIESGVKTIAILGSGVDRAYPASNKKLMEDIIRSGAVYSEYPPGITPYQQNFPRRNRLISGMSIGIIVVEAGERSGALITAGYAGEQGRDVFAVPGNISSPMSKGSNALLRDGAFIAISAEDIVNNLNKYICLPEQQTIDFSASARTEYDRKLESLSETELSVVRLLTGRGPQDMDSIAGFCKISAGNAGSAVVLLEIKGIIRHTPDGAYEITQR